MAGDGVSDVPALRYADVSFAVAGSSPLARARADITLTRKGLHAVVAAVATSREVFSRFTTLVGYRMAVSFQLLAFFFVAVFLLPPAAYYNANFCPVNLKPSAVTSCYAPAAPAVPSLIRNGPFVEWYRCAP